MKKLATLIVLVVTAFNGPTEERVVKKSNMIYSETFAAIHNLNVPMVSADRRIALIQTRSGNSIIRIARAKGEENFENGNSIPSY